MKRFTKLGVSVALAAALPAFAVEYAVVGLGFENMQVQENLIYTPAQVWNFYNGGYSRSVPPPPPPDEPPVDLVLGPDNYSVPFTSSALALMSTAAGGDGNFGPRYLDVQGARRYPMQESVPCSSPKTVLC